MHRTHLSRLCQISSESSLSEMFTLSTKWTFMMTTFNSANVSRLQRRNGWWLRMKKIIRNRFDLESMKVTLIAVILHSSSRLNDVIWERFFGGIHNKKRHKRKTWSSMNNVNIFYKFICRSFLDKIFSYSVAISMTRPMNRQVCVSSKN